ncbi:hypothetical protein [Paenibacillus donghaensis]|uniref:Uncharacterized protein n=1 Tax=Paenibacillus donghaensis TaxID=414771 RepID=A0A2Z2K8W4_9BACL|nr:hypothetical protein [Paenibacillus donghaensis]ASA21824.1 hypothetical protein B9T62_14200 [Paenibacillus donghaensis]
MSTPYEKVQKSFYAKFQSPVILPDGLIKEFFETALSEFELELYELQWSDESNEFETDLKKIEINLLGRCMYTAYLEREIDRIIKLTNIVGKDISLTGMGDAKRFSLQALANEEEKISKLKYMLKTNSFYDEG